MLNLPSLSRGLGEKNGHFNPRLREGKFNIYMMNPESKNTHHWF